MNYHKKTINDVDVSGKKVLLRCDFNVPQDKETGAITSDKRIVASLPTIRALLSRGAAVIACSHLGKPKGQRKESLSLAPVAARLSELLGQEVIFAKDVTGEDAKAKAAALQPGQILLLENLRFDPREEKNDPTFAKELADMAELYVSDAFGTVHRAHASTAGVAAYLPAVSGLLVAKELQIMGGALENPKRPFVAVLGGAKVSDKIGVINNLLDKADTIIIGGGMAYTFAKAQGGEIGKSLCESDKLDYALDMIEKAKKPTRSPPRSLPPTPRAASSPPAPSPPTWRAWTSAPTRPPRSARPSRARARSSGTGRWASLSLRGSRRVPAPWRRHWPTAAPSQSSAAATARRPSSRWALPTRSPTSPPAAARLWSSSRASSCPASRAFWISKDPITRGPRSRMFRLKHKKVEEKST